MRHVVFVLMSTSGSLPLQPYEFVDAMAQLPAAISLVTLRDELDDVVTTASSLVSVSLQPALISICTDQASYFNEALAQSPEWAVTVLSATQRHLAGRCSAPGRPSARLLLAEEPHHRGAHSAALIVEQGVVALECRTIQRIQAGDHYLVIAEVAAVDYINSAREPLIRLRRTYRGVM